LRQSWNHLFNIRLYQMIDIVILTFILLQLLQLYLKSLFIWRILFILKYRYWYTRHAHNNTVIIIINNI
jgi:hypothetical protein